MLFYHLNFGCTTNKLSIIFNNRESIFEFQDGRKYAKGDCLQNTVNKAH